MKTFEVYQHPTQSSEAVKEGFSWPAFFFGPAWLLFKQLWLFAAAWIALSTFLAFIEGVTDEVRSGSGQLTVGYLIIAGFYLGLWLIPAFKGNRWCSEKLRKCGYKLTGTVQAQTPDSAVAQLKKPS
jgi:uncharacterized protein DUF2628